MRKKISICIIVLVIILLAIIFFMIFKKINNEDLYDLSNDELIRISNSKDDFPENFIDKNLGSYERIINSSDSVEDAENAVLEEFNSNNMGYKNEVAKCNIILQSDNYYGLDVSWLYSSPYGNSITYSEKVISFKKNVYDRENNIFNSKNKEAIKEVLDLTYYMRGHNTRGSKVLQSSISETSDYFEYTIYYIGRTYGDWGVNDELQFKKDVLQINKNTGKTSSTNTIELRRVEIK